MLCVVSAVDRARCVTLAEPHPLPQAAFAPALNGAAPLAARAGAPVLLAPLSAAQAAATRAAAELAIEHEDVAALVGVLGGPLAGDAGVMEQVCYAVANVTCNNDDNRVSFAAAGGIPRLVALLGGVLAGNAGVMKAACWAVDNVTGAPANRPLFIAAGGVAPLHAAMGVGGYERATQLKARFPVAG